MQEKRFNVLIDLQWGSCGKGKFAPWLADVHGVRHVSCSHRPNAGHTVRIGERSWVLKCLPSAVALRAHDSRKMACYLSAGASWQWEQLEKELAEHKPGIFVTHPRAMEVKPHHRESEQLALGRIASTMQGAGAALVEKIQRSAKGLGLAADVWLDIVDSTIRDDGMLHEAAQGWELSLDHGFKYPHVTSRNCGTAAALDEMGVNPRLLGDVYGVFRPYPIRVGNFGEHSSGPAHGKELVWRDVLFSAGAPEEVIAEHIAKYEMTTVTKRLRRVFEFNRPAFERAVRVNGVTKLILNFAEYVDWEIAGAKGTLVVKQLPKRLQAFIEYVQSCTDARIVALGTGPEHSEVIILK